VRAARSLATATLATTAEDIVRERAAALSRLAGVLEGLLEELARLREAAATASDAERGELARQHAAVRDLARRWRWYLLVQREANGLLDQGEVDRHYPLPPPLAAG
jgi:hypothetical protein